MAAAALAAAGPAVQQQKSWWLQGSGLVERWVALAACEQSASLLARVCWPRSGTYLQRCMLSVQPLGG